MNRIMQAMLLLCASFAVNAADDLRISQLELDVRNLQREVQAQSQQIEELRRQSGGLSDQPRPSPPTAAAAVAASSQWVDASRWQQIKPGMTELEVISVLGPPASMRINEGERVLLYAMEIGSSGFLSGSVTLRERVVLSVQKPVLQ